MRVIYLHRKNGIVYDDLSPGGVIACNSPDDIVWVHYCYELEEVTTA